jgi:hypothetical protein
VFRFPAKRVRAVENCEGGALEFFSLDALVAHALADRAKRPGAAVAPLRERAACQKKQRVGTRPTLNSFVLDRPLGTCEPAPPEAGQITSSSPSSLLSSPSVPPLDIGFLYEADGED